MRNNIKPSEMANGERVRVNVDEIMVNDQMLVGTLKDKGGQLQTVKAVEVGPDDVKLDFHEGKPRLFDLFDREGNKSWLTVFRITE